MNYSITNGAVIGTPELVTLEQCKANSVIEYSDNDALYTLLRDAAVEDAENYTGQRFKHRNVTISFANWATVLELPLYPVQSITSVTYVDEDGDTQTVALADYLFYETNHTNKLKFSWATAPSLEENNEFPIQVACVVGYADEDVPAAIKHAVLMRFSHKERFREEIPTRLNTSFYDALRPYKRWK